MSGPREVRKFDSLGPFSESFHGYGRGAIHSSLSLSLEVNIKRSVKSGLSLFLWFYSEVFYLTVMGAGSMSWSFSWGCSFSTARSTTSSWGTTTSTSICCSSLAPSSSWALATLALSSPAEILLSHLSSIASQSLSPLSLPLSLSLSL